MSSSDVQVEVVGVSNLWKGGNKIIESCGNTIYSPKINGKVLSAVAETPDMALLIGLGYKYDGLNSKFPKMAARMLGINSSWAGQVD